jgi:predicted nucleic acid-binding protein
VLHVLRRYERAGDISGPRAQSALVDLGDLPVHRYSHVPLLPRMWELRANLTGYDAAYVALAEVLEAPLVTADAKLASAPGHRARIQVL